VKVPGTLAVAFSCAGPSGVPCLIGAGLAQEVVGVVFGMIRAAAWTTVRVWPPIAMVPLRLDVAKFPCTPTATVPLPVPLAIHMLTHESDVLAVQSQPGSVATSTV
jgi:hypothetical protein